MNSHPVEFCMQHKLYVYTFQTFYYRRGAQIQITLPKFGLALLFMYKKKLVSVQKQVYYNNLCSEICWIINSLLYKKEMFLEILTFYTSSLNSRVWKLWNFLSSVFFSFVTKGQTISEWVYEVIVSPKIRTKNCQDFCPV